MGRQPSVALSSSEVEIVASSEAAKEAVHEPSLAEEYSVAGDAPINLFMDNESGIKVAYNPEHFGRMKHVDRKHFYVRELVEDGRLRVPFVRSHDNIADLFTKPLDAHTFFPMRDLIMNVPLSLREGAATAGTGGRSESVCSDECESDRGKCTVRATAEEVRSDPARVGRGPLGAFDRRSNG